MTAKPVRGPGSRNRSVQNFRGQTLSATEANFDGADLSGTTLVKLIRCSCKNAKLTEARGPVGDSAVLDGSDFSGATMQNFHCWHVRARSVIFRDAKMVHCDLRCAKLQEADFRGAELTHGYFPRADMQWANLSGAKLLGAILHLANLRHADLSKADLRRADLSFADLRGATINSADFTGAFLGGAKLTGLDLKKAKGLAEAVASAAVKSGPAVSQLAKIARQSDGMWMTIKVERLEDEPSELRLGSHYDGSQIGAYSVVSEKDVVWPLYHDCPVTILSAALLHLGQYHQWRGEKLILESLTAGISKGPMEKDELAPLAAAAWCEVFGIVPPSAANQEAAHDQMREELLELLRQGRSGVEQWNKYDVSRLQKAGHFRNSDLSKLDLDGINLHHLDFTASCFDRAGMIEASARGGASFQAASFRHANLTRASLSKCQCARASFEGANLNNASLWDTDLRGANLKGANLTCAYMRKTDLRGADLTRAKLEGVVLEYARFDQDTKFPRNFAIPAKMTWRGKGPRPGGS